MRIIFNGIDLPITLRKSDTEVSRHTGHSLRHLEVEFVVNGDAAESQVQSALKETDNVLASLIADTGESDGMWMVKEMSSSYRDGRPVFQHSLELREHEELKARALQFAGLAVEPYTYEEQFDGDALVVTAKVIINRDQQDALFREDGDERYFPVIRVGLSEEPRMMRLGRCLWSHGQEVIKQEIVLVDQAYDDNRDHFRHGFDEPALSRLEEMALEDGKLLCSLCDVLLETGALSTDAFERLAPDIDRIRTRDSRDFLRVKDLDEW